MQNLIVGEGDHSRTYPPSAVYKVQVPCFIDFAPNIRWNNVCESSLLVYNHSPISPWNRSTVIAFVGGR